MNQHIKFSFLVALIVSNTDCSASPSSEGKLVESAGKTTVLPATTQSESSAPTTDPVALTKPSLPREQIFSVVMKSSCAKHQFAQRGRAPVGFIKGVALTYAKSYCELKRDEKTAATVMSQPLGSSRLDSLTRYGRTDTTPLARLRAVYALSIGEGMRESSGNTTEGRDRSVPIQKATEANAEAGIFQISFDSLASVKRVSPESEPWLRTLYDQYQKPNAVCELETFMEQVRDKNKRVVGFGEGAHFQILMKTCPAFATEFVQVMLRSDLPHFGPISRKEAELFSGCETMLKEVEVIVDSVCQ